MNRLRGLTTGALLGTVLVVVFAWEGAWAAPAINPDSGAIGITVTITGEGFGKFVSTGVNEVLINGIAAEVVRWRDTRIEVKVPSNATTGPLLVRLASVDPLPDGSCCASVGYSTSAPVTVTVMTPITLEPTEGPLGNPVV